MMKDKFELYLHIPFCVRKCNYCDFLSFSSDEAVRAEYVDALCNEIKCLSEQYKDRRVSSIFIGGGTPSILSCEQIRAVCLTLKEYFNIADSVEFTIESNPGTLDEEKLRTYISCGINRLSIGLQSANDAELKLLGRIHDYATFLDNYQLARKVGFENINIDLISSVPTQTLESYEKTLDRIIALNPEHISAYSLIIEEGTPFFDRYSEGCADKKDLPDEDTERDMYHLTREKLKAAGYEQYEISNYAKEGCACQHNVGYWTRVEYLGLGLGASSFVEETRWKNTTDMKLYVEAFKNVSGADDVRTEIEDVDEDEQIREYIFLGLRTKMGVDAKFLKQKYGIDFCERFVSWIKHLEEHKLAYFNDGRLVLTIKGMDVANYVIEGFM